MATARKSQFLTLFVGDLLVFIASLWVTLAVRTFSWPDRQTFFDHLAPFSLLFIIWVLVFFIGGLYDRHVLLVKSKLPGRVVSAHLFNLAIAGIFFYTIPYFGVAPKVTLFLYLLVSAAFIAAWRLVFYPRMAASGALPVVVLAEGAEIDDLRAKLSVPSTSSIKITAVVRPSDLAAKADATKGGSVEAASEYMQKILRESNSTVVAVDLASPHMQLFSNSLYSMIFAGVQFVEVQNIYEDLTDKVPLGLINDAWFMQHASIEPNFVYDFLKRVMDIALALPLFIISLLFYPFVWIAMKIEDGGAMFYTPLRIGEGGKEIKIYKFRSMSVMDTGNQLGQNANKITKLGKILRVTRIDELPQLWNILNGDLSLIGPRPEFPSLVELYKKEIPHYNVRHLIQPGLSGWAQIHHEKPPHSVEETKEKLAYDLYYIKHRSLWLDLKIALQTIKTLLSRVGA